MKKEKYYYVYILASQKNGTLYIGVTSNLKRRIFEHKEGKVGGFTKKYNIGLLVYYVTFTDVYPAIEREKQLKKWKRDWKTKRIERDNPEWEDLYDDLF